MALASAHHAAPAGPRPVTYRGCPVPATTRKRVAITAAHCWTVLLPPIFRHLYNKPGQHLTWFKSSLNRNQLPSLVPPKCKDIRAAELSPSSRLPYSPRETVAMLAGSGLGWVLPSSSDGGSGKKGRCWDPCHADRCRQGEGLWQPSGGLVFCGRQGYRWATSLLPRRAFLCPQRPKEVPHRSLVT